MSASLSTDDALAGVTAGGRLELFFFEWPDGHLRDVTGAFAFLLGMRASELNGRSLLDLVAPGDRMWLSRSLTALDNEAQETTIESRFVQSDGRVLYVQWVARRVKGTDLWAAAGTDTADLVKLLSDRQELQTRLDLAIGQVTAAMWDLELSQGRFHWERQAAQILGVSLDALPEDAEALAAVVHPDDRSAVHDALRRLIDDGTTEVALRVTDGAGLRHLSMRGRLLDGNRGGKRSRAVGLLLDVTTEKAMEEQLLRMSASDPLTGTPNRRAFHQALRGEWRRCSRSREPLSLIMVDIDGFRKFNDTFGDLVGDQALITVTRALSARLNREGDLLARYGGEEFAIVLPHADLNGALAVAQQLVEAVRAITIRQAPEWNLSVSVGTASWRPGDEQIRARVLLARANEALLAAKAAGKNCVIAYEESLAAQDTLQAAIAEGLRQREFELYYQPVVNTDNDGLLGFEALMRWNRPGRGLIAPVDFIPAAEASSLICDLGRWALQEAACQIETWSRQGIDSDRLLRVAVNVSARHAASPGVVTDVKSALQAIGIAPERLVLELTETALQQGTMVRAHLAQIRDLGVRIAIDDFGTGYTSIGQLAHLPADALKIDRVFTSSDDPRQLNLVRLIVEAAHAFSLRVVAEGIEDQTTLDAMRDLNCDSAQGYHIAKPMPAEDVPGWLAHYRAVTTIESR